MLFLSSLTTFMLFVFQRFGDEGQRAASSALPPQRPSTRRFPEGDQAVDGGEEQLLEEEAAAAVSLRQPEDDSSSARGELQTRRRLHARGNLLGASAAQPRRLRLHGEEDQTLLADQRPGGSAAEAELHRGGGRSRSGGVSQRGEETELESASESCRRVGRAGERL